MPKDKKITQINGIFKVVDENTRKPKWSLDEDKLSKIVKNEECFYEITKDFYDMHDSVRFNAQIVLIEKEDLSGNVTQHYVISLGHFIYAHHFKYFPTNQSFHETIINQEFFQDVVEPFQNKLNTQSGDFFFNKR
ncbi:hypothetical protein [Halalkalibacter hemicellulosilyticus]|uniref:Uncharacterized protein n=1 Tax=Halalkalibacter hemicellulosilyticusJCM 9152 TaxID=1236971 RepID=W4QND9_9BACI|nr:hypothetical protein [Halalkalibacter hemicellulosilyticus]GAE32859.1 hypothetical protein JCM9152_4446 [Halalkalibacter hemicellulosilyticusJCM 9152]